MSEPCFLGVDVGTTAIKAAIYDRTGKPLAAKTQATTVSREKPGWSEQSMLTVWQTAKDCIAHVVAEIDSSCVRSIGVCGQGDGLWALDKDLNPVRNAILWNDARADDLVLGWIADGTSDRLSRYSRTANWAGTAGSAFRWLKQNEPENARRVAHVLFCKDWINFNLTGNLATDFSDASIPFLDLLTRRYTDDAFELIDVTELKGKLPDPQPGISQHGKLRPALAAELGLEPGLPVATGAIDLAAMMTGMDLMHTGDVCLIMGTAAVVNVVIDPEPFSGQPVGATLSHPYLDKWIRVIGPQSGASAFDWFTSIHPKSLCGDDTAEIAGRMNEIARGVPPGANGVLFLPFLSGERAPFVAPHAKASFLGLTVSSTQGDMARAVMEGAAFSLKHCFRSTGTSNSGHAFLTGGGARNPLWCDIVANVIGTEISASDVSDHGLWGAAMLGAIAAGEIDPSSSLRRQEATRHHPPNPDAVGIYEDVYGVYESAIEAMRPVWDRQRAMAKQNT